MFFVCLFNTHPISGSAQTGFFSTVGAVYLTGLYWGQSVSQSTLSSGTGKRRVSEPGYTGQRAFTGAAGDMRTDVDEQRLEMRLTAFFFLLKIV